MSKIRIKQAVIVEGKYDKITLSQLIDAAIIPVNGFALYKDEETKSLIKALAKRNGIIILTDSDGAGFQLRRRLKDLAADGEVINVYIPDIAGKERRKRAPSKEGLLGVEGMSAEILRGAFEKAGVFSELVPENREPVTKADLLELGLCGGENSSEKRRALQEKMGLPKKLSANSFLEIINAAYSREEFFEFAGKPQE